jgi:signal transduction histidine kinase
MTPRDEQTARSSRFPRNGILWLLAGLLGVATIHATGSTLHDTGQRRAAAWLAAREMAEKVVTRATLRLDAATLPALAPATRLFAGVVPPARDGVLDALLGEQRAAERCHCRPVLPVRAFFRVDVATGALDLVATTEAVAPVKPEVVGALVAMARAEVEGTRARDTPMTRLHVDAVLGDDAAVTALVRDTAGEPTAVVGLITARRELLDSLFSITVIELSTTVFDSVGPLARLDSRSLEVRGADGVPLHGAADSTRRIRATVVARGALEGLAVTVALAPDQIAGPLIAPVAADQLWHLGALLLATLLAAAFAVRSSRREALLARARSDFVAGVSHELRMPLAQILLASETLTMQRERDESERLTLANSILREARRLIALVENVLLFSRTGAVELRPRLQPVAVDELMIDVVEAVQLAVDDVGQTIETTTPPALAVIGDRGLLRQALVNLVDNAMKYGVAGQRIRVIAEQASPGLVRLIVEDEGRGVPHADRARVFAAYERLERDQTSERTGTGLGLAVVRQIVVACGGRVWLEETFDGGTRAVVELRVATVAAPASPSVLA